MSEGAAGPSRAASALALALLAACGAPDPPRPTRGYVLVSLDTVAAAHLGAYGYERDTSPFFDRLAARGTLFVNVHVQYPSTLVSHASMLTGLYPREHGVRQPGQRLAPAVETLAERFRRHGFVTGGFTEGGFVSAAHAFDRGFDEFFERRELSPDDEIERTLARGLDFIAARAPDERFFVFLHTYSAHDPYEPPEPYRSMFLAPAERSAVHTVDSSGPFLRAVAMGRRTISAGEAERLRALYDGSLRYVDSALERFFAGLDALGIADEVTVILTSDHGEEFLQHGKLGHHQLYPEVLQVPLLVVHPDQRRGARVETAVESIDLAPTLLDLAGVADAALGSGRSLARAVGGGELPARDVFAEVLDQGSQRSLLRAGPDDGGRLFQYLETRLAAEPDGTWVTRRATFDLEPGAALEVLGFGEPRTLEIAIDGRPRGAVDVADRWTPLPLAPADRRRSLTLVTGDCAMPLALGLGADSRCLSFKVRGAELRRRELFDLAADPAARVDLAAARPALTAELAADLAARRWSLRAPPERREPPAESIELMRALGYID